MIADRKEKKVIAVKEILDDLLLNGGRVAANVILNRPTATDLVKIRPVHDYVNFISDVICNCWVTCIFYIYKYNLSNIKNMNLIIEVFNDKFMIETLSVRRVITRIDGVGPVLHNG